MSFRRGFKAEAERIATEVRAELSVKATSRLDPHLLAKHLGIPVLRIKDCLPVARNRACLERLIQGDDGFSAITIFVGTGRYIVHNEGYALTRQANNIVHEIAHCLLEHPPAPVTDDRGCRCWNRSLEDEANWLAGALLVPREGALALARSGETIESIAENFGISQQLSKWRIYQTGVAQQLRAGSRWARGSHQIL